MIRLLASFLVLACILSETVRADQDAAAREVVERAIKATGGAEQLARFAAHTAKTSGTYHGMGQPQPYESQITIRFPDCFRMEIVGVFTIVLNGNQGWVQTGGETREMDPALLKQNQTNQYAMWVTKLLPLREPTFKLSAIGDSEIGGEAVLGVRVKQANRPDVDLFFSKGSGRLIQSVFTGPSEDGSKEVRQETNYKNYKEFGTVWFPTRVELKRDGNLFVEEDIADLEPAEKLASSVFSRP